MKQNNKYNYLNALSKIGKNLDLQQLEVCCHDSNAVVAAGLKLYARSGFSNTVTVFEVPEGLTAEDILHTMREEHNILIAGSFDVFSGKVIRIGHMGNNASVENMKETLKALDETLFKLGFTAKASLLEEFTKNIGSVS